MAGELRLPQLAVLDSTMAYREAGRAGAPVALFLHGNPTSSYLWRDVSAQLEDVARCVMPDLIGMGDSDRLDTSDPNRYTFASHRAHLDGLLEALDLTHDVILVLHDWGSALGFDWAYRHPEAVRGICYMESITAPLEWEDWPEYVRELFQGFRSPAGEQLILEGNAFVETVLPGAILRDLSEEEMDEYRRPFRTPGEDRRPTLTWPRQIPIGGEPANVVEIVRRYGAWLSTTPGLPKLFVNATPGAILTGQQRDFCRTWPDQEEITVPGVHFVQEDSGKEIGLAVRQWMGKLA